MKYVNLKLNFIFGECLFYGDNLVESFLLLLRFSIKNLWHKDILFPYCRKRKKNTTLFLLLYFIYIYTYFILGLYYKKQHEKENYSSKEKISCFEKVHFLFVKRYCGSITFNCLLLLLLFLSISPYSVILVLELFGDFQRVNSLFLSCFILL